MRRPGVAAAAKVPRLEANPRRPARRKRRLPHRIVELNRDDLHVPARSQAMDQPGKPDADAGADLQNPATAGDRRGQGGQQSAHFDLAGEPDPPLWAASADPTASSPATRNWAICAGTCRAA
jgi:hypothetical protein